MPDDCASVSDEMMTSNDVIMTTSDDGGDDVQQQLDNSLLQSDAGDEDRLQIVEEPTADEDEQHEEPTQDAGQCPPAGELVDDHPDTASTGCPSTPAPDESAAMPTDEPPVCQVLDSLYHLRW